ncbi:hypothetical protein A8B76_19315 [Roseovarius indicus]|nr:hypothetical protein A8B76_19315 [Roseovarius indicus]
MVSRRVLALVMMTGAGVGPAVADDLSSYDTVMICKGDTLFAVPAHPGLFVEEQYVSTREEDRDNPRRFFWEKGDPPLRDTGFTINEFAEASAPSTFDLLLGRASGYVIEQLIVGGDFTGDVDDWTEESQPSGRPGLRELPGHRDDRRFAYLLEEQKVFAYPVKIHCTKGLPAYSKDSETHYCVMRGVLSDRSHFRVLYNTGRDLPGHWPNVDQPTSDWEAPIAELEEALGNIIVAYGPGNRVCE